MKRLMLSLLLILSLFPAGYAIQLSPESKVSLLTCASGDELYSYFGHTAVRINDPKSGIDYVFNYGVFSFDSPNFAWRFMKGETDYMLAGQRMPSFIDTYIEENRSVFEQVLNISQAQQQILLDALVDNAKPENRVYRYRHFSDNCSTRVRDQFEKCVNNQLKYDTLKDVQLSYRQLIDQCVPVNSWNGFGIKIALGIPADQITTFSQKMFLPSYLMNSMAEGIYLKDGISTPFTLPKTTLFQSKPLKSEFDLTSPPIVVILFFLAVLGLTFREYQQQRRLIGLDFFIFLSVGLAGLLLSFLCFYSLLEATGKNLNLIWAFPFHAPFAVLWLFPSLRDKLLWYLKYTGGLIVLFLLALPFLPQTFHWLIIPLCLVILLRTHGDKFFRILLGKKDR